MPRLVGATLAHAPAPWLFAGFATALFGVLPRATAAAWAVLAACLVIGLLGGVLGLPSWAADISPFEHIPHLPAANSPGIVAPSLLAVIATALTATGPAGFRRRDVGRVRTQRSVPEGPFGPTVGTPRPLTPNGTARRCWCHRVRTPACGHRSEEVLTVLRPVVVGLDGSRESLAAADWAAREAFRRGLPLRVVHVWEGGTTPDESAPGAPGYWARRMLDAAADRLGESHPELSVSTEQITGVAPGALVTAGDQAELLVLGSRAFSGFGGFMASSVALATVAHMTRPVVLVRAGDTPQDEHLPDMEGLSSAHTPYRDVVVGVDPAHACEELLSFAFESAALRASPLRAVYAWRLPYVQAAAVAAARRAVGASAARTLTAVLRPWREKFPMVEVQELAQEGSPAQCLLTATQEAGLLVVGRRIRSSRFGAHTGPVTHAVMHHVRCPVAVVAHE